MKKGTTKPDDQMRARYRKIRVNGKQVNLARHLMEQKLGRPLEKFEYVHHINGIRLDDSPENLTILTPKEHSGIHVKGHKSSPETRQRVSQSLIGNQRRKGIPTPQEIKDKISKGMRKARKEHPDAWHNRWPNLDK